VPEYIENGKVVNLHKLNMKYENHSVFAQDELIHTKMTKFIHETMDHSQMVEMAVEFYENGMSCLDFIRWIENAECIDGFVKTEILMKFDNFNIIWDHAVGIGNGNYGRDHGIAFIGNNGTLVLSRSGWEVIEEKKNAGNYESQAPDSKMNMTWSESWGLCSDANMFESCGMIGTATTVSPIIRVY
jgi:hypothetical protein